MTPNSKLFDDLVNFWDSKISYFSITMVKFFSVEDNTNNKSKPSFNAEVNTPTSSELRSMVESLSQLSYWKQLKQWSKNNRIVAFSMIFIILIVMTLSIIVPIILSKSTNTGKQLLYGKKLKMRIQLRNLNPFIW